ncbi:MAG: hypothetical protein IT165_29135 [Bryobacterales bacterium]|nr:hypothetical protein [Bryobacterales bacterium]
MTTTTQQQGGKEKEPRWQPSLAVRGERRRMERRLQEAGIVCQPQVSIQYQTLAKRSVLRGVESGGARKEIGRYFTFCDETGGPIAWLQPIDSVALNGRHAVVIAPGLVSVDVFRVRNTYDVLIAKHAVVQTAEGQRGRVEARVLFRGREGHLPLDLAGDDKQMVGQIVPEFFNKAGEPIEIPKEFMSVLRAAVRGANCVGCTHQHYLTAPKAAAATTSTAAPAAAARAVTNGVTTPAVESAPDPALAV